MPPPKQDRRILDHSHIEAVESATAKQVHTKFLDARTLQMDSIRRQDGSLFLDQSSRLLQETASQPTPNAGNGRFWVRSADSKCIFTNDIGTDVDLTLVATEDVLGRDNDANEEDMTNISSIVFSDGIRFGINGYGASTVHNSSVAIGYDTAATGANGNDVVIGRSAQTDGGKEVVVGANSHAYIISDVDNGNVVVGANSKTTGHYSLVIGYNSDSKENASAYDNRGCIVIGSNFSASSLIQTAVVIAPNISAGWVSTSTILSPITNTLPTIGSSIFIGGPLTSTSVDISVNVFIGSNINTGPGTSRDNVLIGHNFNLNSDALVIVTPNADVKNFPNDNTTNYTVILGNTSTNNQITNRYTVSIGTGARSEQYKSVAIGYNAKTYSANGGQYSVVLGSNQTYLDDVFTTQQQRIVEKRGTVTTSSAGPTTLMSHDLGLYDAENTSFRIDVSVLGRNNGNGGGNLNDTHCIILKKFHFRNVGGSISFVSGNEETFIDSPDADFLVQEIDTTGSFATSTQAEYMLLFDGNDTGATATSTYVLWNDTAGDGITGSPYPPLNDDFNDVPVDTSSALNDVDMADALTSTIHAQTEFDALGPDREVITMSFYFSWTNITAQLATTAQTSINFFSFIPSQGQYFKLYNAYDIGKYYVWADTLNDGMTGDPMIASHTGIPVNISGVTHWNQVKGRVYTALSAALHPAIFNVQDTGEILITNIATGFSTGVVNVNWSGFNKFVYNPGSPRRGQYFFLNAAHNTPAYHVWYDTTGSDTAPSPAPNGTTAIRVNVSSATGDNDVASLTEAAIEATGNFTVVISGGTLATITNVRAGVTTLATNGIPYDPVVAFPWGPVNWNLDITQLLAGTDGYGAPNRVVVTNTTASVPGVVRSINNTTLTPDPWQNVAVTGTDTFLATLTLIGTEATVQVLQRDTYEIEWVGVMRICTHVSESVV